MVSSAAGYVSGYLGRRQADRWLHSDADLLRGLVERHGTAAVIVTRPIPVAAETVSVLCGCAAMDRRLFAVGSLIGNASVATAFSAAGAVAASHGAAGWGAILAAVTLGSGAWWVVRRRTLASR